MAEPYIDGAVLRMARCPHCNVDSPNLERQQSIPFGFKQNAIRYWAVFCCASCRGAILAETEEDSKILKNNNWFPKSEVLSSDIPPRIRQMISDGLQSIHLPSTAILQAGSAVDAMLQKKGYAQNDLFGKIKAALAKNEITPDMSDWAHSVRLETNIVRHADQEVTEATKADAERSLNFAKALAQYMFVLPAEVARGRAAAKIPDRSAQ